MPAQRPGLRAQQGQCMHPAEQRFQPGLVPGALCPHIRPLDGMKCPARALRFAVFIVLICTHQTFSNRGLNVFSAAYTSNKSPLPSSCYLSHTCAHVCLHVYAHVPGLDCFHTHTHTPLPPVALSSQNIYAPAGAGCYQKTLDSALVYF